MMKNILKTVKSLKKKGIIYYNEEDLELNCQIEMWLAENVCSDIPEVQYQKLKNDKKLLLLWLAKSSAKDNGFKGSCSIKILMGIIDTYYDLDDSICIGKIRAFMPNFNAYKNICDKAWKQIEDGKFKNMMFE